MSEINRVLRAASWRVAVGNFLFGLVYTLAAALAAMIVLRLVEQLSSNIVMWKLASYIGGGVCLLGGIAWAIFARPDRLTVARKVDEGAGLKESISTALCVQDRQSTDPWARATVETATRIARGVPVAKAVPIAAPKFWPVPLALGLALAVVFLAVPKLNWFTMPAINVVEVNDPAKIVEAKAQVTEAKKKLEEMTKKLELEKDKPEAEQANKPEPKNPEEIKKAAVKELTKLNDQLEELRNGVKAQKLEAMTQKLQDLKPAGEQTSELSKAMASGNFAKAKEELEKLKQQAQAAGSSGDAKSQSQKKDMARQLDELAKQMEKMAQNQKDLEKQMQAAGIDPKLASSPEALAKAIEQNQNLSDQQKKEMQSACQSASQCQSSMQSMAQSMQQMSQSMQSGDEQSMQSACESAQGQLSEMEQLSQEMAAASAAQSECQSQMSKLGQDCQGGQCTGEGQGQGQGKGQGQGDSWSKSWANRGGKRNGQGSGGGTSGADQSDFDLERKKWIGPQGNGPIVGTRFVQGDSIKGESKAEFVATIAKADQAATEAIENNTIPREYHDAIKSYFGRLKNKGGAPAAKDAEAPMSDDPDAQPAKDAGK